MTPLFKAKSKSEMDESPSSEPKSLAMAVGIRAKKRKMAQGGQVTSMPEEEDSTDMVGQIMAKRKMAAGGMVDLDHNGTESENMMDDLNEDALKENYEDSELESVHEPMESKGHPLSDADARDMVEQIRRKVMSKREG